MSPAIDFLTPPTGKVESIIDLMERIDRGSFEEFQKESIRRDRLFDLAMPGIEKLSEFTNRVLGGDFENTAIGRAAQAQAARSTSNLKQRIRESLGARGLAGQPLETSALLQADIQGGAEVSRAALSALPGAFQAAGQTLPGLTQLAQPRAPQVQTGALQYLGQVLPYNLNLESMFDKWANLLGQGQGANQALDRPPRSGVEQLFNFRNN